MLPGNSGRTQRLATAWLTTCIEYVLLKEAHSRKGPKFENFGLFFTLLKPFWVGDLGVVKKRVSIFFSNLVLIFTI
jgi:hypothetical protein